MEERPRGRACRLRWLQRVDWLCRPVRVGGACVAVQLHSCGLSDGGTVVMGDRRMAASRQLS